MNGDMYNLPNLGAGVKVSNFGFRIFTTHCGLRQLAELCNYLFHNGRPRINPSSTRYQWGISQKQTNVNSRILLI